MLRLESQGTPDRSEGRLPMIHRCGEYGSRDGVINSFGKASSALALLLEWAPLQCFIAVTFLSLKHIFIINSDVLVSVILLYDYEKCIPFIPHLYCCSEVSGRVSDIFPLNWVYFIGSSNWLISLQIFKRNFMVKNFCMECVARNYNHLSEGEKTIALPWTMVFQVNFSRESFP